MEPEIPISEDGDEVPVDQSLTTTEEKNNINFGDFLSKYLGRHFSVQGFFSNEVETKKLVQKASTPTPITFRIIIGFLASLPFLCVAGFLFSIAWPWFAKTADPLTGLYFPGTEMALEGLILTISISGLIGYGTNFLAIRMLFKPVQKRPIWGQGVIPAQRDRIIGQLAKGIHENILSEKMIKDRIHQSGIIKRINTLIMDGTHTILKDKELHNEIRNLISEYLTDYLNRQDIREELSEAIDTKIEENVNTGLKGFLFRTYRRFRPADYEAVINDLIQNIPASAVEILNRMEEQSDVALEYLKDRREDSEKFLTQIVIDLLDKIDIRTLLLGQMQDFDERKLEKMVWQATNEQLRYIQLLGTILGILGGLLIWEPGFMTAIYAGSFVILWLIDSLLFNLKSGKQKAVEAKD